MPVMNKPAIADLADDNTGELDGSEVRALRKARGLSLNALAGEAARPLGLLAGGAASRIRH